MARSVAVYLRVSTRGQDTASQEPDLSRWAAALPRDTPVIWHRDTYSGRSMDRPGFNRLMADVASGRVGTIAVWRLDRLGRTARGLTALFEDLAARKVNLVSLRDGLDLATAAGRLMACVLASVAAYETEVRAERIRAGLDVARARGVKLGRRPGRRTRIKVTPEQEALIRRLKDEGQRIAAIARVVRLHRSTIYSVLAQVEGA